MLAELCAMSPGLSQEKEEDPDFHNHAKNNRSYHRCEV